MIIACNILNHAYILPDLEKGKSNTTPVYTDDNTTGDNRHTVDDKQHKHTGLPDDSQHTMVIAVAVAVSVVAIVILAVVLVAFRR